MCLQSFDMFAGVYFMIERRLFGSHGNIIQNDKVRPDWFFWGSALAIDFALLR
ncbi:MAG: hypothetical protein CFH37_00904 [Alphaproteobacteria bacterium MarineAlpha9_Bin7]|nr:MAG: hypothetical protein CFH37_00904 [Alphaproteobacteria bacterium MarineAlpha9_Bin7]